MIEAPLSFAVHNTDNGILKIKVYKATETSGTIRENR